MVCSGMSASLACGRRKERACRGGLPYRGSGRCVDVRHISGPRYLETPANPNHEKRFEHKFRCSVPGRTLIDSDCGFSALVPLCDRRGSNRRWACSTLLWAQRGFVTAGLVPSVWCHRSAAVRCRLSHSLKAIAAESDTGAALTDSSIERVEVVSVQGRNIPRTPNRSMLRRRLMATPMSNQP